MIFILILNIIISTASAQRDNPRIMGGSDAVLGSTPYQVSFQEWTTVEGRTSFYHYCSGSIINSRWILTAAQCLKRSLPHSLLMGVVALNSTGIRHEPAARVQHLFYTGGVAQYNIGLVKTKNEIIFGAYIQPIALATEELADGVTLRATGWGYFSPLWATKNPIALQSLNMSKLNHAECKRLWGLESKFIPDHTICAQRPQGQGFCLEDEGGPLVYDNKLYGIIWIISPCATGETEVTTKVSSFGFWIALVQFFFFWA